MSHFDLTWENPTKTITNLKKENADLRLLIACLMQANSELKDVINESAKMLGEVRRGR